MIDYGLKDRVAQGTLTRRRQTRMELTDTSRPMQEMLMSWKTSFRKWVLTT